MSIPSAAPVELRLAANAADPDTYGTVELSGLPAAELERLRALGPSVQTWQQWFPVRVAPGPERAPAAVAPMLGTYRVEALLVRFVPRYPLLEGQRYQAEFGGHAATLMLARTPRPPTRVLQVYPSAPVLPENLLRFYLCFSAPMRQGEALLHVQLVDGQGAPVAGAFLDTREELWDAAGTQLTLLLDPGRVKTGLVAHEQLGRALRAGQSYRLVVVGSWRDAYGEPLLAAYAKSFQAASPAVTVPSVAAWHLSIPAAGTCVPLRLHFPAPLDALQALLYVRLRVPAGPLLEGEAAVAQQESEWSFTPRQPWQKGAYVVEVNSCLEDLAGNNLQGLFDAPASQRRAPDTATLPFVIA